jgi:pimeloyl-ACP methyl ester carboxylesterase
VNDPTPLVLLHGLGMSAGVWGDVVPWLAPHHEVVALTALGHRGGAEAQQRPLTVADLVSDVESALDERGLDQPHLAGNSLGGWMALELARRGRAATVCALSPAGSWTAGTSEQTAGVRKIRMAHGMARTGRALPMPLLMRSARLRRLALRDVAAHGEGLTAAHVLEATDDLLGCVVLDDVLRTDEEIAPLDPPPCPITLAWGTRDAILPAEVNGAVLRERIPEARYVSLPGLGHVPMLDDPEMVARTILESTGVAVPPPPL